MLYIFKKKLTKILLLSAIYVSSYNCYSSNTEKNWTLEEIQEKMFTASPQTIELYNNLFEEGIKDPSTLANLLNLKNEVDDSQNTVPLKNYNKKNWTRQEVEQNVCNYGDIKIQSLYAELSGFITDANDLANALGLIKISNNSVAQSTVKPDDSLERALKFSTYERLKEIEQESRNFDNVDVHKFNRNFLLKYKDFILNRSQENNLRSTDSLDMILNKLSAKKSSQFDITNSVTKLRQHLSANLIDQETGLNVIALLSQVWSACEKLENKGLLFQLYNGQKVNAINYFAWSLEENIATQGGCFPGFSGRFFRDLFTLLMMIEKNNL